MAFLIILSVAKPVALPLLRQISLPVTLGSPPGPPPSVQRSRATTVPRSNLAHNVIIAPPSIPKNVAMTEENIGPPQLSFADDGMRGGTDDGSPNGVPNSIAELLNRRVPLPAVPVAHPPRISHVMEGNLIYRVQPEYPALARNARIQGTVVLSAIISKEGTIENLRVIRG